MIGSIAGGGDPIKIDEAQQALAVGDGYWAIDAFKAAAAEFRNALAIAEGA